MEQQPPIRIVSMDRANVGAIAALERECFSCPWSLDGLVEELSNPMAVFRVAMAGDVVAGYIGMHHVLDEGHIANIAVGEAFRGRGVASGLMDCLIAYAREHALAFLTLEVRPSNKAALALYDKYEFKEEGRRKNFYHNPTEDGLILTLREFGRRGRAGKRSPALLFFSI